MTHPHAEPEGLLLLQNFDDKCPRCSWSQNKRPVADPVAGYTFKPSRGEMVCPNCYKMWHNHGVMRTEEHERKLLSCDEHLQVGVGLMLTLLGS